MIDDIRYSELLLLRALANRSIDLFNLYDEVLKCVLSMS